MTTTPTTPSTAAFAADFDAATDRQRLTTPTALAAALTRPVAALRDALTVLAADDERPAPLTALQAEWPHDTTAGEFAGQVTAMAVYALLLDADDPARGHHYGQAAHRLLSRTLDMLWSPQICVHVADPLGEITRIIDDTPVDWHTEPDLWWGFHEHLLAAVDPQLRKRTGVWYTPRQLVEAQIRLVDYALATRLDASLADNRVQLIDPATGTGTYLHAAADLVLSEAENPLWAADHVAGRLFGFELDPVAATVANLRLTDLLYGHTPKVTVADTLTVGEPHHGQPSLLTGQPGGIQPLPALADGGIRTIVGNPPYKRGNGTHRHPDNLVLSDRNGQAGLLSDYLKPTSGKLPAGGNNLYNQYVYFWRWAVWAAAQQPDTTAGTVVSLVTPTSFLTGSGFTGMREHLRRTFDELFIIDLGGQQTRGEKEPNVFATNTPVAITIAIRHRQPSPHPAAVWYRKLPGTRHDKLAAVTTITSLNSDDAAWCRASPQFEAPLVAAAATSSGWHTWPQLSRLFPWQHSGVQFSRRWPVGISPEVLHTRWKTLVDHLERGAADQVFHTTRDRSVHTTPQDLCGGRQRLPALATTAGQQHTHTPVRYGWRSFDRQWCLPDARVADRPVPVLWHVHSDRQTYLTTLAQTGTLHTGPAVTVTPYIPDNHHHAGMTAGKDTIPAHRDADGHTANVTSGLLNLLADTYRQPVTAEDLTAYVIAVTGTGVYTRRHKQDLAADTVRIPLTKHADLFAKATQLGRKLLAVATYGERGDQLPPLRGDAHLAAPTPAVADSYPHGWRYDPIEGELQLVDRAGQVTTRIVNVAPQVADYRVSGMKVVNSWLKYRMQNPGGRTNSPLDHIQPPVWTFDPDLMELLWTLEHMLAAEPHAAWLLGQIEHGDLFAANELPHPAEWETLPPKPASGVADQPSLFSLK